MLLSKYGAAIFGLVESVKADRTSVLRVKRWNSGNFSLSPYVSFDEPTESNSGVRSGISNTNMADESGEIILETQDDSEANSVFEGEYGRYLTGSALVRKTEQRNRKKRSNRDENRVSSTENITALQRIVHKCKCASNSTRERAQITRR